MISGASSWKIVNIFDYSLPRNPCNYAPDQRHFSAESERNTSTIPERQITHKLNSLSSTCLKSMMRGVEGPSPPSFITSNPSNNSQNHLPFNPFFHRSPHPRCPHSPLLVSLWNSIPLMKFQCTHPKTNKMSIPPESKSSWKCLEKTVVGFALFSTFFYYLLN